MRLLALLSLALVPSAFAGVAEVPAFSASTGVPVALPPLVELSPELLARWGYDPDKVLVLDAGARGELRKQLTVLEAGRLRRLEILRALRPDDWSSYTTPDERLTEAGMKLVDDYYADLAAGKRAIAPTGVSSFARGDGQAPTEEDFARARLLLDRMFDGAAPGGRDLKGEFVVDARVRDGQVYDITATNPRTGLSLSFGQLFVGGTRPIAETSPYANLAWNKDSKPESWVDYRFSATLGYVDLKSRYFADDSNAAVNGVLDTGAKLGVPQEQLQQAARYATYSDPYESHGIVVTSLLAQLGRAYHIAGPIDASWTLGALIKTMWVAPNAAFDETVGVRARLPGGASVAVFGGVAQNLSPIGNSALTDLVTSATTKVGASVENDPHLGVAFWGTVPSTDLRVCAIASQRWTSNTTAREAEVSLMTTFYNHPLAAKVGYSDERGSSIEYDRKRERVELDYGVARDAQVYAAYERDHIMYGNATVDSNAFMAGFKIDLGGSGSTLTVDELFGGVPRESPIRPVLQGELNKVRAGLVDAANAADAASNAFASMSSADRAGQAEAALNKLSLALGRLEPEAARSLVNELTKRGMTAAQAQALAAVWTRTADSARASGVRALLGAEPGAAAAAGRWADYYRDHEGDIRRAIAMLTDEGTWDAALIGAARAQLISAMDKLGKVSVPFMGKDFQLQVDAPAILAAANILNSRLSPMAPVTEAQVDQAMLDRAGAALGLPGPTTPQSLVDGLFARADAQMKAQLAQSLTPLIDQAATTNPQQLAAKILASLPPNAALLLKQNFGPNLTGLLPDHIDPAQLKQLLLTQLPNQITAFLEKKYGPQMAAGLAQGLSWAGGLISREINMEMIQLMLASEELDRLTADHGEKIPDLDLRMAMRSFDALDARGRAGARRAQSDMKAAVVARAKEDDAALAAKFQAAGVATLQAMELGPSWPEGLRVKVEDGSWLPLLTLYGDGPFFDLVARIKERYRAAPTPGGLSVVLAYRPDGMIGTTIRKDKGVLRLELTRPRDPRDAAFRLTSLDEYAAVGR